MAGYEHLPIYRDALNLAVHCAPVSPGLPGMAIQCGIPLADFQTVGCFATIK